MRGPRASSALLRPRSSPTATPPTSTAATAIRPQCTRATGLSTASRLSPLSRASWGAGRGRRHRPRRRPPRPQRRRRVRRVRLCTVSVVGRAGLALLAALRGRARCPTRITHSACRSQQVPGRCGGTKFFLSIYIHSRPDCTYLETNSVVVQLSRL